ncbi:MAG: hypothetical protein AAF916_03690 [Planctomycetota bacterium]
MRSWSERALTVGLFVGVWGGVLGGGGAAHAAFTLTKIVDTATAVPGPGTGLFSDFSDDDAVIDDGQVAFRALDAAGDEGIFLFNGTGLEAVAFRLDPVPGVPSGQFLQFDEPAIEVTDAGAVVSFEGFFPNGREMAVSWLNGVSTALADNRTTVDPSTGATFDFVNQARLSASASGVQAAFVNARDFFVGGRTGLYLVDEIGGISLLVDTDTPVPGRPDASFFTFDGDVSFEGGIGVEAGYAVDNAPTTDEMLLIVQPDGALTVVADTRSTVNPATGALLVDVAEPGIDGNVVAFGVEDALGNEAVLTNLGGALSTVADQTTAVPGQAGLTFDNFDADKASIEGGRIAIEGRFNVTPGGASEDEGVYVWDDGVLSRILDTTQTLDGRSLAELDLSFDSAISGDTVVFVATFEDGGEAIYTATLKAVAALTGDFNGSGSVEQGDLNLVLNNWGDMRTFDDGTTAFATDNVDQEELNRVLNNWGSSSAPSFAGFTVPEPGGLVILSGLAVSASRRRGTE